MVGAATEKARVPAFVLTLGTESKPEPDDRSCLGCLAGYITLVYAIFIRYFISIHHKMTTAPRHTGSRLRTGLVLL